METSKSKMNVSQQLQAILDNCEDVEFDEQEVPKDADIIFQADNTLVPIYAEGQYIFVQLCSSLEPWDLAVVALNGHVYLKTYVLVYAEVGAAPRVVLSSLQKDVPPIYVSPNDSFDIIGRVIA